MSHMRPPGMRAGRTKGGDTIAKPDHPAVGNSNTSTQPRTKFQPWVPKRRRLPGDTPKWREKALLK